MADNLTPASDPAALVAALKRLTAARIGQRKTAVAAERAAAAKKAADDEVGVALTALTQSGTTAEELRSLGITVPVGWTEKRGALAAAPAAANAS